MTAPLTASSEAGDLRIASPEQTPALQNAQHCTFRNNLGPDICLFVGTPLQAFPFPYIFVQVGSIYPSVQSSMASEADHQHSDDFADSESSNSWQTVSDYLADSESSDSWQTVSPPPPASAKMKSSLKPSKSRRVTIHSPSEEDLHERYPELGGRRAPTPYAFSRHSTPDEDNRKATTTANTAANAASNAAPPGVTPYNAPGGTVPQLGPNQLYTHALPAQALFNTNPTTNFAPYPYSINQSGQPGQPTPISANNGANMDGYQNAFPNNAGLHFQPQVPDTSLGPMTHIYQPRFDNGCVAFPHPGIVVCQPSSFVSVSPPPLIPLLTTPIQPVRPVTFAPQPLVVAPAVAPVLPTLIASAPVYTTLGYLGDDGMVAPRVLAVRRV